VWMRDAPGLNRQRNLTNEKETEHFFAERLGAFLSGRWFGPLEIPPDERHIAMDAREFMGRSI